MDNNNEKWYHFPLITAGIMGFAVVTVAVVVIFFAVVEAVIKAVFF